MRRRGGKQARRTGEAGCPAAQAMEARVSACRAIGGCRLDFFVQRIFSPYYIAAAYAGLLLLLDSSSRHFFFSDCDISPQLERVASRHMSQTRRASAAHEAAMRMIVSSMQRKDR